MAMEQAMKQVMKHAGLPPMAPAGGAGVPSPFAMPPFGMPASAPAAASASPLPPPYFSGAAGTVPPTDIEVPSAAAPPAGEEASSSAPPQEHPKRPAFVDVEPVAPSTSYAVEETEEQVEESRTEEPLSSAFGAGSSKVQEIFTPPAGQEGKGQAPQAAGSVLDMLKNPEMQKTLYPYLPEHMRNPQTFHFMLSNPEMRKQLEQMMSQQMQTMNSPEVQEMMKGVDAEQVTKQMNELGVTPEQMMQKVMADPELAMMMTKPKVMKAMMEMNKNPMAMLKYQSDPEVAKVFEKLSGLFPQAGRSR